MNQKHEDQTDTCQSDKHKYKLQITQMQILSCDWSSALFIFLQIKVKHKNQVDFLKRRQITLTSNLIEMENYDYLWRLFTAPFICYDLYISDTG
jgi:hypothetical protein